MILKFLKHIWPSQGFYCVAVPAKTSGGHHYYQQKLFTTIEDAAIEAAKMDKRNKDCYMAVGTLKERKVWDEKEGKFKVRTHTNMGWYKSLILDIDCGEGKPYADQKEANAALQEFRKATLLPVPTIVNSGYGLHVYYTMDRDVDAEEWYTLSLQLKAVAKHLELKVDDSRTSDKSSVLRVAGTNNYKRGNIAPVAVLKWGEETRPETLKGRLTKFIADHDIKVVAPPKERPKLKMSAALKEAFAGSGDVISEVIDKNEKYYTPNIHKIAERCNFIRHALEVRGEGFEEPSWRHALSVTLRSEPLMNTAVSDGHSGYSEGEMLVMVERLTNQKPFMCTTIAAQTPELCEGCTQNVRNPLMLDMRLKSQPILHPDATPEQIAEVTAQSNVAPSIEETKINVAPSIEETKINVAPSIEETKSVASQPTGGAEDLFGGTDTDMVFETEFTEEPETAKTIKDSGMATTMETKYGFDITIPDPPYPYKLLPDGIYIEIEVEDGVTESEKICDYYIRPYGITADAGGGIDHVIKVSVKLPRRKKENKFEAPASDFWDNKIYSKLITGAGVFQTNQNDSEALHTYMKVYIKEIQRLTTTIQKHSQLGWHDEGEIFVLPEQTLHKDGTKQTSDVAKGISSATKTFGKKGTLEEWRSVIDVYNRPKWEKYAFGHLVGYGSLLMRFTKYSGAIVNFVGEPGTGKTGILNSINTIFGHPTDMLLIHEDKYLAKMARFGIFNSVCVTYDEITNIDNEELSSLCYAVSQGRGRHRLTQNAELKDNDTTWQMILASTSNISLLSKLSSLKNDGSAESLRVFEYRIDKMGELEKNEAEKIFDKFEDNYGHAGEPFIKYVIEHEDRVQELVNHYRAKFDEAAEVPINERFWSAIVSTALAGGQIANELQLANLDIDRIFGWAVNQVRRMRTIVTENNLEPHELLAEFISEHYGYMLTVTERSNGKEYMIDRDAHTKLYMRSEKTAGKMYINKKVIRKWLAEGGSDAHVVKTTLKSMGILLDDNFSKTLTAGSDAPSTGQVRCWLIDTNHPKMSETLRLVGTGKSVEEGDGIDKRKNG